ncbi:MAG: CTP synthase [Candidatus Berkelbacteria bacterium]|nr:CTP synthase [Candidatus Berkelbacteria bacterium]
MKYIFVSGGVISGLGKGVTTASVALLLKSRGIKVTAIKCDAYMNVDAGTIRPQEHGEVFVTDDGIECDQDIGHYERFINENLNRTNYVTNGQIYQEIIRRERSFEYNGEDVEIVPHVPEEMIRRFKYAGRSNKADVVIIEVGGTVGEYQNVLFIEANRIMKYRDKEDVIHIHVGYLPTPTFLGEMKSKPVQTSVRVLSSSGIQPDFIIGRAEKPIDEPRKERIAWLCNIDKEDVISNPDVDSIYKIPIIFKEQKLDEKILRKLGIKAKKDDLKDWKKSVERIQKNNKVIKIGIVGKYATIGDYTLGDAYISVVESIKHAAWINNIKPEIKWIDAEKFTEGDLKEIDGIVIPGGFGKRGIEGKIKAIKYAREHGLPFLGLCLGLQMAVVEFARNICGLKDANSTEINPKTNYPVIDIMPEQKKFLEKSNYGATMRLGKYPCKLSLGTKASKLYETNEINERHRHRYEVNPKYHQILQKNGLIFSGLSPNKKLVEIIELKNHPFFVATQFHPEFKSRFTDPHPLFMGLIQASNK